MPRLSLMAASFAFTAAALLALPAGAQTTPRAQAAQPAASAASAVPRGPGPRGRMGPHMMGRSGSRYTPGWSMMTPQERDAHRDAMRNARTYDECRKALDGHRELMQQRAKERGLTMPGPRRDACAGLPRG